MHTHVIDDHVRCGRCGRSLRGVRTTNQHIEGFRVDPFTIKTPAVVICPDCDHHQLYLPPQRQAQLPPARRRSAGKIPWPYIAAMAAVWSLTYFVSRVFFERFFA